MIMTLEESLLFIVGSAVAMLTGERVLFWFLSSVFEEEMDNGLSREMHEILMEVQNG